MEKTRRERRRGSEERLSLSLFLFLFSLFSKLKKLALTAEISEA